AGRPLPLRRARPRARVAPGRRPDRAPVRGVLLPGIRTDCGGRRDDRGRAAAAEPALRRARLPLRPARRRPSHAEPAPVGGRARPRRADDVRVLRRRRERAAAAGRRRRGRALRRIPREVRMTVTVPQQRTTEARTGEAMLAVEGLVKRYPKRPVNAVDGISFSVARGELFGLLGPNGAGKTTTIGALTTRVAPTAGRIRIAGVDVVEDPVAAKRRFGVVPQTNNLDRALSARQNLLFHAAYF